MDEVFSLPRPIGQSYINDCEYRVLSNPDNPGQSAGICKLVSLESGIRTGITAVDCAKCKRSNAINKDLIRSKVRSLLNHQLHLLDLGFYTNQPLERVEDLYRRCYKHFVFPIDRQSLATQFSRAVADKLLDDKWANDFLIKEMPELLMINSPANVVETPKEVVMSVPPAAYESRAMDVDFGCCGGRSIFKLLGNERLTLTSPDGGAFSIDIKRISGLSKVTNSNVTNSNTMIKLYDGGVLFCRESQDDIAIILKDLANASDNDAGLTSKLLNAGRSLFDVARSLYGKSVDKELYESRKLACESCPGVDSYDKLKLFRKVGNHFSCGRPFWKKPLRDRSIDGCGCILDIKWAGENQSCPLKNPKW
jgi:hypothetical protein